MVRPKKKNSCVSGSPTDPVVLVPTVNFFFSSRKKKKKKIKKKKKKKNVRCAFNVRFGSLSAIRLFYFSNMAAPVYWPSSVVAIKMNKCDHLETKKLHGFC